MAKVKKFTEAGVREVGRRAGTQYKRFMALSDQEKEREADAAAALVNGNARAGKPQTAAETEFFRRAGRRKTGEGVKVISLSVEKGLLDQADALCKKLGVTRAELVARGLRHEISERGAA